MNIFVNANAREKHSVFWQCCIMVLLIGCTAVQAEPPDPFSTQGLVAATPAAGVNSSPLPAPCTPEPKPATALSLADVVERALCNNPQTQEVWANARLQAAQLGVAESARLPSLSVNGTVSRNWPDDSTKSPDGIAATDYTQRSANVALTYLLYDFGGRAANVENARQILSAANASQDAVIQSVFLAAVQAYYQYLATEAALTAAREAERFAQESLKVATARYHVGAATPADKLQAQTAYSQAVLNRIRVEGDSKIAQGALANSMGMDANQPLILMPPITRAPDTQFDSDIGKLIEVARRQRPDLVAAEAQVNAAHASVDAAKASGLPSISLAGIRNYTDRDTNITSISNNSALGITVSIPLFTGFNTSYRIRAAQEQVAARLAQREQVRQQIALDVWKAYQNLTTESQAARSSTDLVASATESYRVAAGRYKAGVGTILDLLTAQSALASAQQQNVQALYNWYVAKATLAQAMGQLDFSTLDTTAGKALDTLQPSLKTP